MCTHDSPVILDIVGFNSVKLEQLSGEPGCIGLNERHLMST